MNLKQQVFEALKASLKSDNTVLQNVKNFFFEKRSQKGFCLILMEFVNNKEIEVTIRQGAAIQLKNIIQYEWTRNENQKSIIDNEDKQHYKNNMLQILMNVSHEPLLVKICRRVVQLLADYECPNWDVIPFLIQKLQSGDQNIVPVLQCCVGIVSGLQHCFKSQNKTNHQIIEHLFPFFRAIYQNSNDLVAKYLVIKIIWKLSHYDMQKQTKKEILQWMPVFKLILMEQNPAFENIKDIDYQDERTPQFYYFHTKKWVSRIVHMFLAKHMKFQLNSKFKQQAKLNKLWYFQHGNHFLQIAVKCLQRRQSVKVKYYLLRMIDAIVNSASDLLKPYVDFLLYTVLIQDLKLNNEDIRNSKEQPLQFLANEDQSLINCTNVKVQATKVWIGISQIGNIQKSQKGPSQPGPYFNKALEYIQNLLSSTINPENINDQSHLINKEIGMYLLCKMSLEMKRFDYIRQIIPRLLQTYIIPQLDNPIALLRCRAIEIFGIFVDCELPIQLLNQAAMSITQTFTNKNTQTTSLLKIKSSIALCNIVRQENAKQCLKTKLPELLQAYLTLLNEFDIQLITTSFEYFISAFSNSIGPYATKLILYLIQSCKKILQRQMKEIHSIKDKRKKHIDSGIASLQCIRTIVRVMQAITQIQTFQQIQSDIIGLIYFAYGNYGPSFQQDLYPVVQNLINGKKKINNQLWFIFMIFIYSLTGPCVQFSRLSQLLKEQSTILSNDQKHLVMLTVQQGNEQECYQYSFSLLRQFILYGNQQLFIVRDPFGSTLFDLIYNFALKTFKDAYNQQCQIQLNKKQKKNAVQYQSHTIITNLLSGIGLLISVVENSDKIPQNQIQRIWGFIKLIYDSNFKECLKDYVTQLLFVLLYSGKDTLVRVIYKDGYIEKITQHITEQGNSGDQTHQKMRMILGLCQFLAASYHQEKYLKCIDQIYQSLVKAIQYSVQDRLYQLNEEINQKDKFDQDDFKFLELNKNSNSMNDKKKVFNLKEMFSKNQQNDQKHEKLIQKFSTMNITSTERQKFFNQLNQMQGTINDNQSQQFQDQFDKNFHLDDDSYNLDELWDQQYGQHYSSKLQDFDDLEYFLSTMQAIEKSNPTFYNYLKGRLKDYGRFTKAINTAIRLYEE